MRTTVASLTFAFVAACTGSSSKTCIAGQSLACTGPEACSGFQICAADGQSVGACQCGTTATSSSTSATSSTSASAATGTSAATTGSSGTTSTAGTTSGQLATTGTSGASTAGTSGATSSSGASSTSGCLMPTGSYAATCAGCTTTDACDLTCSCLDDNQQPTTSSVQLPCDSDGGIDNCNGLLNCTDVPDGSYLASCIGCVDHGCMLSCACDMAGNPTPGYTALPLPCPAQIANCGGTLTCEATPDAGYLAQCSGCSVDNCSLGCTGCSGISGPPTPLALPCEADIFLCSGALTCATPLPNACPQGCTASPIVANGANRCEIGCTCTPTEGGPVEGNTLPYPCDGGYTLCQGGANGIVYCDPLGGC